MDSPIFFSVSFQVAWASPLGPRSQTRAGFRKHSNSSFRREPIYISLAFDGMQTEEEWKIWIYKIEKNFFYTCIRIHSEAAIGLNHRVSEERVLAEIEIGSADGTDQSARGKILEQLESVKILLEARIVVVVV